MNLAVLISLLPLLPGLALTQAVPDFPQVREVVIEHEVIIRVPARPRTLQPVFDWVERDGPKCISPRKIRGALLSGTDHVDFVMSNKHRIRAKLDDDCLGLDFYGGFYISPQDGHLCAGRDDIRSRVGGVCPIDEFLRLEAVPRRSSP